MAMSGRADRKRSNASAQVLASSTTNSDDEKQSTINRRICESSSTTRTFLFATLTDRPYPGLSVFGILPKSDRRSKRGTCHAKAVSCTKCNGFRIFKLAEGTYSCTRNPKRRVPYGDIWLSERQNS